MRWKRALRTEKQDSKHIKEQVNVQVTVKSCRFWLSKKQIYIKERQGDIKLNIPIVEP